MLSKYEYNIVSAALKFFNSEPSFSLEGRIIRRAKEEEKKKMTCIEYLPCIRLSKTTVDINRFHFTDEEPRGYKAMCWPSIAHLVK